MIQANEIQVGNIVLKKDINLDGGGYIRIPVMVTANVIKEIEARPSSHFFEPIPITRHIIEDIFKFELLYNGIYHLKHEYANNYALRVTYYKEDKTYKAEFDGGSLYIKYAHELQQFASLLCKIKLPIENYTKIPCNEQQTDTTA